MSEDNGKRYYWLKLKRDFFKRHDIRIIESMPNGKDYILFYLKLLCESVDHNGELRFSEQIPYSEDMLATVTNTNIDIVRSAIKVLTQLEMMEILDDGTIFMDEVQKMIGSYADNDNANRQRRFRERKRQELLPQRYDGVTKSNESKRIEIDIEKEKDIESRGKSDHSEKPKRTTFTPPTPQEVTTYCLESGIEVDANAFCDYYESNGWMVGKNKMKSWKAAVRNWERHEKERKKPQPNDNMPRTPDGEIDYAAYARMGGINFD